MVTEEVGGSGKLANCTFTSRMFSLTVFNLFFKFEHIQKAGEPAQLATGLAISYYYTWAD